MKTFIKLGTLSFLAATVIFTGCGNDSTTNTTINQELKTGYFIDAAVEGLTYETSSGTRGITDQHGKFQYKNGDSIRFAIGKLNLGEAVPLIDGLVTPQILTNYDETKQTTILRLLQALDLDNNPSNGITIPQATIVALENLAQEVTISSLQDDNDILNLDSILAQTADENYDGVIDVTAQQAQAHFTQSLTQWNNGHKPDTNMTQNNGNGQGNTNANTQNGGFDLTPYPISELKDQQRYTLAYMWNEEKLAKDIYLALNEVYPSQQFYNIATRSETKHQEMVENLIKRYDINITNLGDFSINYSKEELEKLPAGTFSLDIIQSLYNTLYEKGIQSKVDALQVGCMVEVTDVNDLNEDIEIAKEVNAIDLVAVFESLRAGSYNHYWVFDKALKTDGVEQGCASAGKDYAKTEDEYPTTRTH